MNILTEEQLLKCIKGRYIYIYGAGDCAKLLIKRLDRYGVLEYKVVTSDGKDSGVLGVNVVKFSDVVQQIRDEDIILIATIERHHAEIEQVLKNYTVTNYHTISNRLYNVMYRLVNKIFKLQTHIVEHCNLNCRGCYHFSSLAKEEYIELSEFEKDIKRLSELFNGKIDEVLLLGGEPLLHPKVEEFFYITRKYFVNAKIKILTNGLLLPQKGKSFWESIVETGTELWVTKYPVNFDYDKAVDYAKSMNVELNFFNQEPVRTLGHQPLDLEGKQDYCENFVGCYRANECIDLKHGKVFSCIIPAEIKPFSKYFHKEIHIGSEDFVDIYEVESAEELLEKLEKPMPFCRFCNRESIDVFGALPWSQTEYKIDEWTM